MLFLIFCIGEVIHFILKLGILDETFVQARFFFNFTNAAFLIIP